MFSSWIYSYTILFSTIIAETQSDTKTKDSRVDLTLKAVLELKDHKFSADMKLLRDENSIGKVKTNNDTNNYIRRSFIVKSSETFTEFIKRLVEILESYNDADIQQFLIVIIDEAKKYHYKGCKFYELIDDDVEKFFKSRLDTFKNKPVTVFRKWLRTVANKIEADQYTDDERELFEFINSLYRHDSIDKLNKFLMNIESFKFKTRKSTDLTQIVNDGLRAIIFNHYTRLHRNKKTALKSKVEEYLKYVVKQLTSTTTKESRQKHKIFNSMQIYSQKNSERIRRTTKRIRTTRPTNVEKDFDLKYDISAYDYSTFHKGRYKNRKEGLKFDTYTYRRNTKEKLTHKTLYPKFDDELTKSTLLNKLFIANPTKQKIKRKKLKVTKKTQRKEVKHGPFIDLEAYSQLKHKMAKNNIRNSKSTNDTILKVKEEVRRNERNRLIKPKKIKFEDHLKKVDDKFINPQTSFWKSVPDWTKEDYDTTNEFRVYRRGGWTFSTVINEVVLSRIQDLENDLKFLKNQVKNDTDAMIKRYSNLSNNIGNHKSTKSNENITFNFVSTHNGRATDEKYYSNQTQFERDFRRQEGLVQKHISHKQESYTTPFKKYHDDNRDKDSQIKTKIQLSTTTNGTYSFSKSDNSNGHKTENSVQKQENTITFEASKYDKPINDMRSTTLIPSFYTTEKPFNYTKDVDEGTESTITTEVEKLITTSEPPSTDKQQLTDSYNEYIGSFLDVDHLDTPYDFESRKALNANPTYNKYITDDVKDRFNSDGVLFDNIDQLPTRDSLRTSFPQAGSLSNIRLNSNNNTDIKPNYDSQDDLLFADIDEIINAPISDSKKI